MRYGNVVALLAGAATVAAKSTTTEAPAVATTTCNGKEYKYRELAGYGTVPGAAKDEFGDTINFGSALALDRTQWKKLANGSYTGVLWGLPDRGW